jgi:uncharacterized protein (TIGR00269 family)
VGSGCQVQPPGGRGRLRLCRPVATVPERVGHRVEVGQEVETDGGVGPEALPERQVPGLPSTIARPQQFEFAGAGDETGIPSPRQRPGYMECDKCDRQAVMHAAYSGAHLCGEHLCASVEKRVRRRVRRDALVPRDASPDDPETWVIGLSGGKDSVVLTHVLAETFGADPRIELVALSIHEGIEGYRDASLDASRELAADLDIEHEVVGYEAEFGVRMDDVAADDPLDMAPCAYCGVFRRDVLERYADDLGADKLLTGHNLDDEAQTALMNVFEGDLKQMAKHYDASLGPFDRRRDEEAFVPRAKPLRDVPEKEVALYAHLMDLPAHITECPHASEAYRGEIRDLLLGLEEDHPGTRHSIMAGYEELAELAAERYRGDDGADLRECERCGSTTAREVCRKCRLLDAVGAV